MASWSVRRRLTGAGGVLCRAVAAAGVAGWWYRPWREKYAVAVPPPPASACQVVLAYLRALAGHDSATAYAVSAPDYHGAAGLWLNSTEKISRIWVGRLHYYAKGAARRYVPVTFSYFTHWWQSYPDFPNGWHQWGYVLVGRHGRFLIADDGVG
jgi:hypothetical protein